MNLLFANDRRGAYPDSWYAATAHQTPRPRPLKGDACADVLVIGAGFTGLSAALRLAEAGLDVILVDAHCAGWGASGRNGGQLGTGMRMEQPELEAQMGEATARRLWALAEEAKATAKDLIARHGIACDYRPGIVSAVHKRRLLADYRAHAEHMARHYDHPMDYVEGDDFREIVGSAAYHGGTIDETAGHLHPLNYALGLARAATAAGARIHEETEILALETEGRPAATTATGRIEADHMIVAANGYLGDLAPSVAAKVMPINNFIIATEPLDDDLADRLIPGDQAVADSKFVINYFRLSRDRRMLFGGRESYGYKFPADIQGFVRTAMIKIFPELAPVRIDHGWGGTLAITQSRLPHMARLGPSTLSATGYSGHGVALATLSGKLAAEAVLGQAEKFDLLSSLPTPAFPGGPALRGPLLVLAMLWYTLRDRI